jgi:hypothetical protein
MAAVEATAITKIGEIPGKGGTLEFWTMVIDPDSLAAAAQVINTVDLPGARAGDPCMCQARVPEAALIVQGATVTADDVVSVYMSNNITVTTALDSGALVYDLQIFKRAISPTIP